MATTQETQDPRVSVQIVDDAAGFAALRPVWNNLLRIGSTSSSPFLTWEWLYSWWTTCGGRSGLHLMVVHFDGIVIAIAPLRVSRPRPPWFRVLEFLGAGAGSDYLDILVKEGFEGTALRTLSAALDDKGLSVCLTNVRPDSLAARLGARLQLSGWTAQQSDAGVCPLIRLNGHTWDSYLASRGSSHRANVRRRLSAAERAFRLRFSQVASHAERVDALKALAAFHARRWREGRPSTASGTRCLRAFHHDMTERAFNEGWLRLYTLHLDDALAGVMYAFVDNERFYFYQHGFDERYKRHSLGLVLMALTVRAALDEGASEFDLLWGVESYKWLWADAAQSLSRIDLFPPRWDARINRRTLEIEAGLRAFARRVRSRDGHVT